MAASNLNPSVCSSTGLCLRLQAAHRRGSAERAQGVCRQQQGDRGPDRQVQDLRLSRR